MAEKAAAPAEFLSIGRFQVPWADIKQFENPADAAQAISEQTGKPVGEIMPMLVSNDAPDAPNGMSFGSGLQTKAPWNAWMNFGSGAVMGRGPELAGNVAAMATPGAPKPDARVDVFKLSRGPGTTALDYQRDRWQNDPREKVFHDTQDAYEQARKEWAAAHPGLALGTDIAGGVLPAGGIGMGANVLLRGMGLAGRVLAGTAGDPASWGRFGSQVVNNSLQGAIGGAVDSGITGNPMLDSVKEGALAGGALRIAGQPIVSTTRHMWQRGELDPLLAGLGIDAIDRGIPLGMKQIMGEGPGSAEQTRAFTQRLAATTGSTEDRLTPKVLGARKYAIGDEMGRLGAAGTIANDQPFHAALDNIRTDVMNSGLTDNQQRAVLRQIENVRQNAGTTNYADMTKRGSALDRMIEGGEKSMATYGVDIRDALDKALERGSPGIADAFREQRLQYKNVKTLEEGITKAQSVSGRPGPEDMNPLLQAIQRRNPSMTSPGPGPGGVVPEQGAGDIGRLGQIGDEFLSAPQQRLGLGGHLGNLQKMIGAGAAEGTIFWALSHNPMATAAALGIPAGIAMTIGQMRQMTPAVRSYLSTIVHGPRPWVNPAIQGGAMAYAEKGNPTRDEQVREATENFGKAFQRPE